MPGVDATAPSAGGDEFDDLFNYDIDIEDVFQDTTDKTKSATKTGQPAQGQAADLGIDEEIQIKKARKPIAKLDEKRLLSERGIPKLRKVTKDKLKFKGKGHEFNDVARMLSLYQLWLDDLYPRAKFLDSLAMIEKLGHTKSMQVFRKDWINEGKPRDSYDNAIVGDPNGEQSHVQNGIEPPATTVLPPILDASPTGAADRPLEQTTDPDHLFLSDDEDRNNGEAPEDDEFDALLAGDYSGESKSQAERPTAPAQQTGPMPSPEDELDDLLAESLIPSEQPNTNVPASTSGKPPPIEDEFADDMEAMADLDMW